MTNIIAVIGVQRSGAGLLSNALGAIKDIVNLGDIFQCDDPHKILYGWRKPIMFDIFGIEDFPFSVRSPIGLDWPKIASPYCCTELFKGICSDRYTSDINLTFHESHKARVVKILLHQCPHSFSTWKDIVDLDNVKFIYVKRHNVFDAIVSNRNCCASNQWFLAVDSGQQPVMSTITIDPNFFLNVGMFIEQQQNYFDIFLRGLNNVLYVSFDDLTRNKDETLERVQKFLGFKDTIEYITQQQITIPHRRLVKNYDELKSHFDGTIFGKYFDE